MSGNRSIVFMRIVLSAALSVLCMVTGVRGDEARSDRFISRTRQLTFEGRRAGEGYFSPDGKMLVFQAERYQGNPFFQIYTLDMATGHSRMISPGVGRTTCSFFRPGSDDVMFASTHLDPQARTRHQEEYAARGTRSSGHTPFVYDEQFDLFSCDRRGRHLKQLTDTFGFDAEGAYSPDGKLLVFCSLRNAYPLEKLTDLERGMWKKQPQYFGDLYIMNADGSNQRRLTDSPGYDGGPFFTPDGERVIYRHFQPNGLVADVYTIRVDGTDKRRLTDFSCMSWAPFMHPSEEYAIFTSNKHGFGNFELFIVDALGEKQPVRVTYTDGFDGLPVYRPDGNLLCWTSNRATRKERTGLLFLADWDHASALAAIRSAPERGKREPKRTIAKRAMTTWPEGRPEKMKPGLVPAISSDNLFEQVSYLASDELEGRMTGTAGAAKGAEYIVAQFKQAGLEPLGDDGTYLQSFPFPAGVALVPEKNTMSLKSGASGKAVSLKLDTGFRPLAFTKNDSVTGNVVCAGYGLVVPGETDKPAYDSYLGLDVAGKIVLVFDEVPAQLDTTDWIRFRHYSSPRYKAKQAMQRGATGFLLVVGPNTRGAGKLLPLDQTSSGTGIVSASISGDVAKRMLAGTGMKLGELQGLLDNGKIPDHFTKLDLSATVSLTAQLERREGKCRNVVGLLPPIGDGRIADEYILVGAHYDHIGRGEAGGSLAPDGEEGDIHNGADDNASGVATVLELAAAMAHARKGATGHGQQRGIIFACWSGEEIGVIGSTYFARHAPCPLGQIAAYVNFDMVGRLREGRLILQGAGSSKDWLRLIEKVNIRAPLAVLPQPDPYLPTDTHEFYPAGIPIISFFTGVHEDYNRPSDDAETLNYAGMEQITRFAREMIRELATVPDRLSYAAVERKAPRRAAGTAGGRRLYTGTIPDFTAGDVGGLAISGVQPGSPAEKAGLLGGDIIIQVAGHEIGGLQDYSEILKSLKPDETVDIVVRRKEATKHLRITPSTGE